MFDQTSTIPNGWKATKLGEVGITVTGKTPSQNNPNDWGNLIDFITPTDIVSDSKYIVNVVRKLSEDGMNRFNKMIIPSGSVIVSCIGSDMGKVVINKQNALTNQQINSIKVNSNYDNNYIYYLLRNAHDTLRNIAVGGSTMPILNKSTFESLSFLIPQYPEQQAIAMVLSSLDTKIETNNNIIRTIESITQTIFRHWFIDFEFPDEKGNLFKSSEGKMHNTEIGEIPDSFIQDSLSTLTEHLKQTVTPNSQPNEYYYHYSIPNFDIGKKPIKELGSTIKSGKYRVPGLCFLVSKLNPKTPRIWTVFSPAINSVCSTEFQVFQPKTSEYFSYLYCFFNSISFTTSISSLVKGTSGSHQRVSPTDILDLKINIPPLDLVKNFNDKIFPLIEYVDLLRHENDNLAEIRDLLLPKLVTGKIRLS